MRAGVRVRVRAVLRVVACGSGEGSSEVTDG